MIRATRRRAVLLALTAAVASFLSAGSDRVLCFAPGNHVAVEPVHPESGCRTLPGTARDDAAGVVNPDQACVDLSLDFGTTSARPASAAEDHALTASFAVVAFAEGLPVPAAPPSGIAQLPSSLIGSDGLPFGTVVLLI